MKKNETLQPKTARFVTGSTMHHVTVMSATGSVGLFAVFLVDFLTLGYIAQLNNHRLTAGIGAASLIMFLCRSVNIGLMIAVAALVSRTLGQEKRSEARHVATASLILLCLGALFVSVAVLPFLPLILPLVGATPEIYIPAREYLIITLPANGIAALGMGASAVLRAYGEARRSMFVTLSGALATAFLAPFFIFFLKLGVIGAGLTVALSNGIIAMVGLYFTVYKMRSLAAPNWTDIQNFYTPIMRVGIPAVGTNLATPIGNAFIAKMISNYGELAYSAYSIVDRLVPVAFCGFFALSGCIGSILGQNWGAQRFDRMRQALKDAAVLSIVYVLVVWCILYFSSPYIAHYFNADAYTTDLITFFCTTSGLFWFFNGMLFCANASFNNLGFPYLATLFNWGRATVGVLPFVLIGAYYGGVKGIYSGTIVGAVVFGSTALITAFWTITKLEKQAMKQIHLHKNL